MVKFGCFLVVLGLYLRNHWGYHSKNFFFCEPRNETHNATIRDSLRVLLLSLPNSLGHFYVKMGLFRPFLVVLGLYLRHHRGYHSKLLTKVASRSEEFFCENRKSLPIMDQLIHKS